MQQNSPGPESGFVTLLFVLSVYDFILVYVRLSWDFDHSLVCLVYSASFSSELLVPPRIVPVHCFSITTLDGLLHRFIQFFIEVIEHTFTSIVGNVSR